MKTLYDDIRAQRVQEADPKGWRSLLPPAVCAACAGLFLLAFHLLKGDKALMNWLILHVTTPYKMAVSRFCDLFPFAVSEVIWALAILAVLVFLVRSVWLIVRRGGKLLRLGRRVLALLSAVMLYSSYYLGGRSIYLMRRLPDGRQTLRRQVWTVPLVWAVCAVAAAAVVLGLCYLAWRFITPEQCIPTAENIQRVMNAIAASPYAHYYG